MPIPVIVCLISACFLLVVSLPALLQKKLHFGVVFPTAVSCLLFLYAALACILPDSRPLRICGVFLTGCIVFGAVTALICSLFMCFGWRRFSALRVKGDETVLVLGCRVYPDHLSKMLVGRLQAAYTLLCRYPGMQCVVSGGKGEDEPCSEAAAMKRWLVKKGIHPSRIKEEGFSRSTMQNFSFSAALIRQLSRSGRIIIATDFFHQFRSALLAQGEGLISCGAASFREPFLLPGYWLREIPGILYAGILLLRKKGVSLK